MPNLKLVGLSQFHYVLLIDSVVIYIGRFYDKGRDKYSCLVGQGIWLDIFVLERMPLG